ncbi:YkvA family protein [Leptolyngbya ohadii]|uniref:YkvA family protein n=1 Tax=Leptolyngbya ohadii TaxID=1962290 RepID=UPI000B59DD10|nr:YkvA family protein [Leptolyngbya ohadii]
MYDWYRNTIRNPKYRWIIILGTLAYLFMPFDFLPDFIPVIGQIDDAVIVTLLFAEVSQLVLDRVRNKGEVSSQASSTTGTSANPVDVNSVPIE